MGSADDSSFETSRDLLGAQTFPIDYQAASDSVIIIDDSCQVFPEAWENLAEC